MLGAPPEGAPAWWQIWTEACPTVFGLRRWRCHNRLEHFQGVLPLRIGVGIVDRHVQTQSAAILHQHLPIVAEFRRSFFSFAGQQRIGIRQII
jgi:hypothetical protein